MRDAMDLKCRWLASDSFGQPGRVLAAAVGKLLQQSPQSIKTLAACLSIAG
jgi:hypothetical protein